jgi:uncharacterized protein YggU (UPF0235/DUF167 family)
MKFLEKISDNNYLIHLTVRTNSKRQKIINNIENLIIYLNSKPIQNKANKELIDLLKRKLKISSNQIRIISGLKSKDKLISLTFLEKVEEKELLKRLL